MSKSFIYRDAGCRKRKQGDKHFKESSGNPVNCIKHYNNRKSRWRMLFSLSHVRLGSGPEKEKKKCGSSLKEFKVNLSYSSQPNNNLVTCVCFNFESFLRTS